MEAMVLLTTLPGATYLAETVFHGGFDATSLALVCCLIAVAPSTTQRTAGGAGAPDGPHDAHSSCCQVHPDVATNTIGAGTSWTPCRAGPPPRGRIGASGTTRWNSPHSSSGSGGQRELSASSKMAPPSPGQLPQH